MFKKTNTQPKECSTQKNKPSKIQPKVFRKVNLKVDNPTILTHTYTQETHQQEQTHMGQVKVKN